MATNDPDTIMRAIKQHVPSEFVAGDVRLHEFEQGWLVERSFESGAGMGATHLVVERTTGDLISFPSSVPPSGILQRWDSVRDRGRTVQEGIL